MQVEVKTSAPEPETVAERRRVWLERSRLYLICDTSPGGDQPEEVLRPALQAGVDIVQLRDKSVQDREIVEASRIFRRLCDAYDALFIVNDSPELAVACAADGVHLGQGDASPDEVRRVIGPDALIGLSTHSRDQIEAAGDVDYIGVGPVYETPTKPGYEPVGLELVQWAAEHARVPFFAIGGIDRANVDDVLDAGACRIAVVRAISQRRRPGRSGTRAEGAHQREGGDRGFRLGFPQDAGAGETQTQEEPPAQERSLGACRTGSGGATAEPRRAAQVEGRSGARAARTPGGGGAARCCNRRCGDRWAARALEPDRLGGGHRDRRREAEPWCSASAGDSDVGHGGGHVVLAILGSARVSRLCSHS